MVKTSITLAQPGKEEREISSYCRRIMPALRAARMRAPVAQCTPRAARGEDPRGVCGVVNDVNDAGSYTCNPGASFPVTATCENTGYTSAHQVNEHRSAQEKAGLHSPHMPFPNARVRVAVEVRRRRRRERKQKTVRGHGLLRKLGGG